MSAVTTLTSCLHLLELLVLNIAFVRGQGQEVSASPQQDHLAGGNRVKRGGGGGGVIDCVAVDGREQQRVDVGQNILTPSKHLIHR